MTGRTCTVENCDHRHVARGLCNRHYHAERRAAEQQPTQRADLAWMADPDRGCADTPWDDLFGSRATQERLAKALCDGCPVLDPCRDRGRREAFGLYGGRPEGTEGRPGLARARDGVNGRPKADPEPPVDLPDGWHHGTARAYDKAGCKCVACREYKAARQREYVERRRDRERVGAAATNQPGDTP